MRRLLIPVLSFAFAVTQAVAASLVFQIDGKVVPLLDADAARIAGQIEALVLSANFNSQYHPDIVPPGGTGRTPVDELRKHSFLRLSFPTPKTLETVGGAIIGDEVWVELRATNPHGGLYPGPLTVVGPQRTVFLTKESGRLMLGLGLDPAVFEHLPPQMRRDLERGRPAVEQSQPPAQPARRPE